MRNDTVSKIKKKLLMTCNSRMVWIIFFIESNSIFLVETIFYIDAFFFSFSSRHTDSIYLSIYNRFFAWKKDQKLFFITEYLHSIINSISQRSRFKFIDVKTIIEKRFCECLPNNHIKERWNIAQFYRRLTDSLILFYCGLSWF